MDDSEGLDLGRDVGVVGGGVGGDEFAQLGDALAALGHDLIAIDYEHEVLGRRARGATQMGGHEVVSVLFLQEKELLTEQFQFAGKTVCKLS